MKASTRFLVLLVIIEALIIGGAFFLDLADPQWGLECRNPTR